MKQRILLGVSLLALATVGGIATLALAPGQPPAPASGPERVKPAIHFEPAADGTAVTRTVATEKKTDELPAPLRRYHAAAQSGAEWLLRMDDQIKGRFQPGLIPDLNVLAEQDSYLHQCGATFALARAARYFGEERYLMKARQATLSLLAETRPDPGDPTCRVTTQPTIVVNRLAAAGLLLMTIHELKNPAEDLLNQGEELANFIRKQQQPDGSLAGADAAGAEMYPGWALQGLLLSIRNRPAPWKLELVAKALPYYRRQWKAGRSLALAGSLTPAFAEAYLRTREQAYADFVFELSDWACTLQYGPENSQPKWVGGFKGVEGGQPVLRSPDISSAAPVEALAVACLVTRHVTDSARYGRYRTAAELGAQFLTSLQYTEANTMHFTPGYRPALIGGYHASLQDGTLRLDYNQRALVATIQRLSCVGDR